MTFPSLRNTVLLLNLFNGLVRAANVNISGSAVTTRFWDCCKPSCGWEDKAPVTRPVQTCKADGFSEIDLKAGTGCREGGTGYLCTNQHPWAINDTLSYGFAGVFLAGYNLETHWCCACYQLDFLSDPLKGKSMIVQASNTAFDVKTSDRFSLAIPGGNQTADDGCNKQYSLDQTVFGQRGSGVGSKSDCDKLPQDLRDSCKWRFDWFKDAAYPEVKYKRVACPKEITDKTQCIRNDEKVLLGQSLAPTLPAPSMAAVLAIAIAGLLSV
ncbi:endoglucanase [Dendryphion nanum]|uniref:cellulase n=1 Tax=Dendryphion nanum TaxID=256645 RepID=A0A9P9DCW7_9PLEO|nr:endoglucanase [Dendryphion nanum]